MGASALEAQAVHDCLEILDVLLVDAVLHVLLVAQMRTCCECEPLSAPHVLMPC